MLKAVTQMHRRCLFCSAPVGVAGSSSLDMLGVPDAGEAMLLIVMVGIFLAAGYHIFQESSKPAVPQTASALGAVPASAG
jgi:hypothetical protein